MGCNLITNNAFEEQVREIRKNISALEWDIQQVNNLDIKQVKQQRLSQYRTQLSSVMNQAGAHK
jgi:uncharacterized protein YdcH (DUF465 family)